MTTGGRAAAIGGLVLAGVALAGCGSDSESDSDKVRDAVQAFYGNKDVGSGKVRVDRVSVKGERATAFANWPERRLQVGLVKRGDSWKLGQVTALGQDPLAARGEIAKCLESRGLSVGGPKDRTFDGRRVPTVFTETPAGNGLGILIFPFEKEADLTAALKSLVNRDDGGEVNVVKTGRGPRLIVFENESSDEEKALAEVCLPEVEAMDPGGAP